MTMLEGGTLIFKAGADARYLGVIDLFVTKRAGSSTSPPTVDVVKAWRMVPVRGLMPDTETAALVKRYTDQLDAELAVEIGRTTMTIRDGDPLSARVVVEGTCLYDDGALVVDIAVRGEMTCTATDFLVETSLVVHEHGALVAAPVWRHAFPRAFG